MQLNEEYTYSILDNYKITAGNAGNLVVLINGKVQGKLGKKGEVIEKLIISSDFISNAYWLTKVINAIRELLYG